MKVATREFHPIFDCSAKPCNMKMYWFFIHRQITFVTQMQILVFLLMLVSTAIVVQTTARLYNFLPVLIRI